MTGKTVVVYTADVGAYDEVWRPVDQIEAPDDWEVSWVYLADSYARAEEAEAAGWTFRWIGGPEDVPIGAKDRLLGRWAKCHPHRLFPDADVTIWVDACLEITSPTFVREVASQVAPSTPYMMFRHPDRESVREEILAAETLQKYQGNRHLEMVEALEATLGGPIRERLWAMTMIARRPRPEAIAVDHLVWSETLRWSTPTSTALDQLILPWAFEITRDGGFALEAPHPTDPNQAGTLWSNGWFTRHPHRRPNG